MRLRLLAPSILSVALLLSGCARTALPEIIPADAHIGTADPSPSPSDEEPLPGPGKPDPGPAYDPEVDLPDESPPPHALEDPSAFQSYPILYPAMLPDGYDGFELPVRGATGYASVATAVRTADGGSVQIRAGDPFLVLEELDASILVRLETGEEGELSQHCCLLNLPDVIPSMAYDATNGYSSMFRSCGEPLDGITGEALYAGKTWNARLSRDEFMMPVLYPMAKKLAAVQRSALEQGNVVVLYEAFRPAETQLAVAAALKSKISEDPAVRAAVTTAPWSIGWFIATSVSNHQRGYAVDVSLARIASAEERYVDGFRFLEVTGYALYRMPTPIHELSSRAAAFAWPVASDSKTAWKSAAPAASMNGPALALQDYFAQAGLTPLSSEWWHFNDLDALAGIAGRAGDGKFSIERVLSVGPAQAIQGREEDALS